jgi:hypothetical protein
MQLQLHNDGTAPLEVTSIVVMGANPGDFQLGPLPLPLTIPSPGVVPLEVVFVPTATGPRSAQIAVTSNDPVNPTRFVGLQGNIF